MKSFYLEMAEKLAERQEVTESNTIEIHLPGSEDKNTEPVIEEKKNIKQEEIFKPSGSFVNTEKKLKVGDPAPDLSDYKVVSSVSTDTVADKLKHTPHAYTSFSGADLIISVNKKPIGEVQSIDFMKVSKVLASAISRSTEYVDGYHVSDYPVIVLLNNTLFNKSVEIPDGADIVLVYANEYGEKAVRTIECVETVAMSSGASIDTIISQEEMVLCAKNITPLVAVDDISMYIDKTNIPTEGDKNEDAGA